MVNYDSPESLNFIAFTLAGGTIPAYKVFMLLVSVGIFVALYYVLARTRVGMIIQAALSYPKTVESLGHNVPLVFMGVFGVGTGLAGLAGVIAGALAGAIVGAVVAGNMPSAGEMIDAANESQLAAALRRGCARRSPREQAWHPARRDGRDPPEHAEEQAKYPTRRHAEP